MDLKEEQWTAIKEYIPKPKSGEGKKGRPTQDLQSVMNGILWICRTGAQWQDMPDRYPPYQTCHRHFLNWKKAGVWDKVLWALAKDMKERGKIDITECFIDGSFASAKKGGLILEKLNEARAPKSWPSQTLLVFLSPYGPQEPAPMR